MILVPTNTSSFRSSEVHVGPPDLHHLTSPVYPVPFEALHALTVGEFDEKISSGDIIVVHADSRPSTHTRNLTPVQGAPSSHTVR